MKKLLTILTISLGVLAVASYASANTSEALQPAGNTSVNAQQGVFDTVRIGNPETGGVTYFNGSIVNEGAAVTIADDLRVDGVIFRGVQEDSDTPVKIYDDVQISGNLTAGSITGLSSMVSTAGFAKTSDLASYAKTSSLAPYAKTTALSSYAKTSSLNSLSDDVDRNSNNLNVLYNYNRCVLLQGTGYTYVYVSDLDYCWDLYVGTDPNSPPLSHKELNIGQSELSYSDKLKMEMDRVTEMDRVK